MLELGKKEFYSIFQANFSFPVIETKMGTAVKMDWLNAFLFANVTGAGYFDNPSMQFSPKGTQKVLREAFKYNLVTGIFDGDNLLYSPSELQNRKPYLFKGYKYIIAMEYTQEFQLIEQLYDLYIGLLNSGENPTDYVIFRIDLSKKGNGMESFLEYLSCEYFKKIGYIVENQVPLAAAVGSPDFCGYGNLSRKGFHINELSLIRFTKNIPNANDLDVTDIIVGEAKTSTTIMEKQLRKYMDTDLYKKGYELHPDKQSPSISSFGLLNLNKSYQVVVKQPITQYQSNNALYSGQDYKSWIMTYFKYYLISNFSNDEFHEAVRSKLGKPCQSAGDVLMFLKLSSINDILDMIKEVL